MCCRVSSEQSRHDLERELEEIYLSKARAEAEREEAMGALRQHREKEELDMNRLLEEVALLLQRTLYFLAFVILISSHFCGE